MRFVEALDIGERLDTDGSELSGGDRRLTSFCMAAVAPGRLVILDERLPDRLRAVHAALPIQAMGEGELKR